LTVVHILHQGLALCDQSGIPGAWPDGHRWVAIDDDDVATRATCTVCLHRLASEMPIINALRTTEIVRNLRAEADALSLRGDHLSAVNAMQRAAERLERVGAIADTVQEFLRSLKDDSDDVDVIREHLESALRYLNVP
jgi:ABC-type transporter Mla subunit MlaD